MKEIEIDSKGDEVLKKVGELTQATETLEQETEICDAEPEEVGTWITVLGKAFLGIFK